MHKPEDTKPDMAHELFSNFKHSHMSTAPDFPYRDSRPHNGDGDKMPLRPAVIHDGAPILIPLIIIIPAVFVGLLCFTAFCIYRCRKRRIQRGAASLGEENNDASAISYNILHNSAEKEELPPPYMMISETKLDLPTTIHDTNSTKNLQEPDMKIGSMPNSTSSSSHQTNPVPWKNI
ncbi:unnamed protein product [Adineta ricciae]|uniref:Uncharacterized protein n=1 Tax=Adineta ricciae TaxID=249248 RepID=A0A816CN74_ADIRI|nr:unnamed protein product [Adineta ricciae]